MSLLSAAADTPISALVCSLFYNQLGPEGAKHVADMLKVNTTLTNIKYAATLEFPPLSAAADSAIGARSQSVGQ